MIFTLLFTAFAASAVALPSTLQRRFTGGSCGAHVHQKKPAPESDYYQIGITIYDGAGTQLGGCTSKVDDPNFQIYCHPEGLPWEMKCTTDSETYDYSCTYESGSAPYTFGSAGGCSVGAFDGNIRESDCGFAC